MTTGALLFAFNNGSIDYVKIAAWTAKNIRRHLGIPVAVVTDYFTGLDFFDKIILEDRVGENQRWFGDIGKPVAWHNETRPLAFDLTPWDQTLVLDVDYVVATSDLSTVLDSSEDFLAHRAAFDITHENDFRSLNHFGDSAMPMWWATVMMFRKSQRAHMIFECMKMVRDNWHHYRNLYGIKARSYRNDYALSIALGIVDGHFVDHASIPWSLASLVPEHALTQTDNDHYRIDYVDSENRNRWIEVKQQDFHAMGKTHLEKLIAYNS